MFIDDARRLAFHIAWLSGSVAQVINNSDILLKEVTLKPIPEEIKIPLMMMLGVVAIGFVATGLSFSSKNTNESIS